MNRGAGGLLPSLADHGVPGTQWGGGLPTKLFYFATLFGDQAVIVFFVISGLLVGGSIARALDKQRFRGSTYAIDRGTRLYVVLIPAVVLTEVLQLAGRTIDCQGPDGLGVVMANLLFLQNFVGRSLCNNHALWSLSSEPFSTSLVLRC